MAQGKDFKQGKGCNSRDKGSQRGGKPQGRGARGGQPRKDSDDPRVNYDNARVGKFIKDVSKDNDPRWYFNATNLSDIATQISGSFVHPTGLQEQIRESIDSNTGYSNAVPGVMSLGWAPEITPRGKSAVSQAMDQIYSFVVHKNSRNYNYDATDQMLLILGTMLSYSFLANAIRAYGVMLDWNGIDYYTPKALVTAMGFDYEDLAKSYHQMSFDINRLIAQLNQLWIPSDLPIAERWFWMNTNIYRDAESAKAQYYLYVPYTYYVYNETAGPGWSSLDEKPWITGASTAHTWVEFTQAMQSMIDALVNSSDRGMILGDLLNAYGADKIYKLNPISQDYKTSVVYDKEVLMQFENASIWGTMPGTIIADVNGNLYSQGSTLTAANLATSSVGVGQNKLLNFHTAGLPTKEDIMVATRMSIIGTMLLQKSGTGDATLLTICPLSCGTEVIVNAYLWNYQWTSGTPTLVGISFVRAFKTGPADTTAAKTDMIRWFWQWSAFDWAPFIEINVAPPAAISAAAAVGSTLQFNHNMDIADYDQYAYIQEAMLNNLHLAAIYSLFNVPLQV